MPTRNLIVPAALSLTSATFAILSVCHHLLFISVPLSTSVFLFASSSVSSSPSVSTPEFTTSACLFRAPLFLLSCTSRSVSSSSWPHFLFRHSLGIKSHSFVLGPNLYFLLSVSHSAPSFRGLSWQRVMKEKPRGEVRKKIGVQVGGRPVLQRILQTKLCQLYVNLINCLCETQGW